MRTTHLVRLVSLCVSRVMVMATLLGGVVIVPPSARGQTDRLAVEMNPGLAHFRSGKYDQAIASYSKAIAQAPKSALVWLGRSMAYAAKNEPRLKVATGDEYHTLTTQIEDDYLEALRLDPQVVDVYRRGAGEPAEAETQKFLKRIETIAAVYSVRADVLLTENKVDEALALLTHSVRLEPRSAFFRYKRGFYSTPKHLDQAISDFNEIERLVRANPQDATLQAFYQLALEGRAIAYRHQGAVRNAFSDLDHLISLTRNDAKSAVTCASALRERGVTFLKTGDRDRALADFAEALRFNPKDHQSYFQRAAVLADQGNWNQALSDLNEAIRLNEGQAESHYLRGYVHLNMQRPNDALRDLDAAIRLAPTFQAAYFQRALAYLANRNADKCLADFDEALRLHAAGQLLGPPDLFRLHQSRGQAFELKGDAANARAEFAKAQQFQPPQVARSTPASGSTDVNPALSEIVVIFDRAMATDGWSVNPVGAATFPDVVGPTPLAFRDNQTLVIKVKLKPETEYVLGFNSSDHPGFVSAKGVRARPFQLRFKTGSNRPAAIVEGPRVIKTDPADGASNVEAGTYDLTIVFDEPMKRTDASLDVPPGAPALRVIGKPRWNDARTWVVPVLLAPGTTYRVGVNTGARPPFASAGDGTPAQPRGWTFRTEAATEPTDRRPLSSGHDEPQ